MITGATGGFGRAFVEAFSSPDTHFILHGRDEARLKDVAASTSCDTTLMVCDLEDTSALEKTLQEKLPSFDAVDLLINNAGLALGAAPMPNCSLQDWHTMIDVNNKALVTITYHVLNMMLKNNKGHIINIASTAGNYPYPGGNVYCASKSFVKQFSLALRGDLNGTDIRVTNLEPGMAETNFSVLRFKGDQDAANKVYEGMTPLNAEDIANAAYYVFNQPPHVNINRMEIMPVAQSFGPHPVARKTSQKTS
jgi:3-hydroxy acid dehydrogenase/malonic semialdehyde reductase